MSPQAVLMLSRAGFYLPAVLLFGIALSTAWLAPVELRRPLARQLRRPALWAAGLAVAATALWLPAEAAIAGGGWSSAADPALLDVLALHTSLGHAFLLRLALTLTAFLAMLSPQPAGVALVATGGALAVRALSGHAVMTVGTPGLGHVANDVLHILAGAAWVGALIPLALGLRIAVQAATPGAANRFVHRFAAFGQICVALVVLTGAVNAAFILSGRSIRFDSPYMLLLAAKLLLVAAMICLALRNHRRLMPRLDPGSPEPLPQAARAMAQGALMEVGPAAAVLVLVAIIGELAPA